MKTQVEILNSIENYIKGICYPEQPEGLYAPIKYILSLGGKRIRPLLMMMAYNLYKEDCETILPQAIALETYHNFTLLHDDLMDNADMRRGNMTVHKKWDANTAILSGDAMLIMAYRLFVGNENGLSDKSLLMKALDTFNDATLGVCDGQQYDVDFESRDDVKEEEYMEMIRLKTSLLLACALKIGAELAGADDEDATHLYKFGEKMGLAFQLQDDLLDVYGDPAVFGKKIGGDILCNKKTFMLINTLNLANKDQKERLQAWIEAKDFAAQEKIDAVTAIYDEVDIRSICQQKIEQLFADSLKELEKVDTDSCRKQPLIDFAHRLMGRNR
ncbi:MAG: polyprenyl synthetase family protein [Bacteroidaceae bacterium]|nr:polyprenyl synthetase family protein [Bacteroidaceae bacterium]